jgi:hypothetical protein
MFTICSYSSAAYPKAATIGHDTSYSILLWWRLIHKTGIIPDYEANDPLGAEDLAAELVADVNYLLRQHGESDPKFIANRLIHTLTNALLHAQSHRREVEQYLRDLKG